MSQPPRSGAVVFAKDIARMAKFYERALALAVVHAEHEWDARGFRACDGHDPEGNVLQVREIAR